MDYRAKSRSGFMLTVKRSADDGKLGICEAGGRKSFYFFSDKSAEEVAKRILEEVKK